MIEHGRQIAFIALSAMTIISAIFVVTLPNILRAALFLAFAFLGVAGLYVLANAELLAAMQVLIYVGAITVLIMFALVLTQQLMGAKLRQVSRGLWLGVPVAVMSFAFLVKAFVIPIQTAHERTIAFNLAPAASNEDTLRQIAKLLLQPYVIPFELASFILLAALIGAIVIAKEDKD
jgi:NADH:ubiquinone oxidoreductase subunit 6 (subunit J)